MKPEVRQVFSEWLTGAVLGATPLLAHILAYFVFTPGDHNHVVGGWAIDIVFIGITVSGASLVSVVSRLSSGRQEVLQGRASPTLILVTVLFLFALAIIYAAVVSGHAKSDMIPLSSGVVIGALFVSLYLELTLASRLATAAEAAARQSAASKALAAEKRRRKTENA